MNEILEKYARRWIKDHLLRCTIPQQTLFKRLYGNLDMPLDQVIREININKLELAIDQIQRTLVKNG